MLDKVHVKCNAIRFSVSCNVLMLGWEAYWFPLERTCVRSFVQAMTLVFNEVIPHLKKLTRVFPLWNYAPLTKVTYVTGCQRLTCQHTECKHLLKDAA